MIKLMILFALACNVAFATETYKAKVGEYTYSYAITSNMCAVIMDGDAWEKIRVIQQKKNRGEMPSAISPVPEDKLEIPDSLDGHEVVEIGDWAFASCSNIVSVVIPASVAKIGKYTFAGCLKLKNVEFRSSCIKEIDAGAFVGCSGLIDVELPDSVLSLGERAFSDCKCLQKMKLAKELECIGDGAFAGDSCLRDVVLPPNLRTLGVGAFLECDSMEKINIPYSLAKGGWRSTPNVEFFGISEVLSHIPNLRFAILEDGWENVPSKMFWNCKKLSTVVLPQSVKSVGVLSFAGCKSLKSLNLPSCLRSINAGAFFDCNELEEISIPPSVTYINATAFQNTPIIGRKTGVVKKDGWILGWVGDDVVNVEIPIKGEFRIADGCFAASTAKINLTVNGLYNDVASMFVGASNMLSLTINSAITNYWSLKRYDFSGKLIGKDLFNPSPFKDCRSLRVLDLSRSPVRRMTLGQDIFRDCERLERVKLPLDYCGYYDFYKALSINTNILRRVVSTMAHDHRDESIVSALMYFWLCFSDDVMVDHESAEQLFDSKLEALKRYVEQHRERYSLEVDCDVKSFEYVTVLPIGCFYAACCENKFDKERQENWMALPIGQRRMITAVAYSCLKEICDLFVDAYDESWAGEWLIDKCLEENALVKKVDLYKRMARHEARRYLLWSDDDLNWNDESQKRNRARSARNKMLEYVQKIMDCGFVEQAERLQRELELKIERKSDRGSDVKRKAVIGTGWLVNSSCVASCWHVVKDAKNIFVELKDGKSVRARVIAKDIANDIVVLKVDGAIGDTKGLRLRTKGVKIADKVFTVGYPLSSLLGQTQKYAEGVVNAISGIANDSRYFQISVPIQPGNSGGPLVDECGNVVGLTSSTLDALITAKATGAIPQNVNYAIKVRYLADILDDSNIEYTRASGNEKSKDPVEDVAKVTVLVIAE